MFRFFQITLLIAGVCLFFAHGAAYAGTPSKGLKIEPMLQNAILDTADDVQEPDIEPFVEEIIWEEPPPKEPPKPIFPVYIEEKEETREQFEWPDEPGYMFNGMLFLPELMVKQGWTDNLYATEAIGESDLVTHLMPSLTIQIPDIQHDVEFVGNWEYRKHIDNDKEDQRNTHARLHGAFNAPANLSIPFDIYWAKYQERREDDLAQQRALNPMTIKDFETEAGIQFKPNSFGIGLFGRYQTRRNEDGRQRATNNQIIRRDADHDVTELEFNTSFDLDTNNTLMLWGTYGENAYDMRHHDGTGFNGPRRDSDTFSGMMSWIFNYTGLKGHMSIGVDDMNYDDVAINDIREIVGDMEIEHQIGDLTSINFQLERSVFEDEEIISPIIKSRAGLYLDQQFWDEVLVAVGADYSFLEFNNTGRDDETWDFRLIGDYFFNDFLAFGAEYGFTIRDSEQADLDFSRNVFMLRARGRL